VITRASEAAAPAGRYAPAHMRYRFGDHTLDTGTLQLLDGSTEVDVEPQVFAVLAHLVRHRERVVPKEELLDEVWGSRFVSESALTTRIKQVRRAVGDTGRDQRVVRTYHGRGYRFVAAIDAPAVGAAPAMAPLAGTGAAPRRPAPRTRYAEGHGASIAYQTFGDGPDLALIAGFATNVEAQWDHPAIADFLTRLGRIARVTVLDKRGVGLSDRVPHDSVPPLETRADDLAAVLDAAGIEHATVLGSSEGGSLGAVFAAAHPERVDGLILHNTWVKGPDFSLGSPSDLDIVIEHWGSGRVYAYLGPTLAADPAGRDTMARYERQSATPRTARHLLEMIGHIDIGGILGAITVPTLVLHRADDRVVPAANGRQLAAGILGARLVMLDGADHYLFSGEATPTLVAIEEFVADTRTPPGGRERVLATVAFVDIVDPEGRLRERGPRSRLHDRFVTLAEAAVGRERGHIVTTTRAGVVATFDGPGRAVRAASALRDTVHPLDLSVRAGVHTAEIHMRGDDIAGIGVDIAARVADAARPGEVWVSRTVTDLVAGAGLRFEARGEHTLEGVDEPWHLFAAIV
jgi:pimeloyl-ACP methyl ester carboxylesterase/DNA-binding winged helix-turn-helix (wHTH) protein